MVILAKAALLLDAFSRSRAEGERLKFLLGVLVVLVVIVPWAFELITFYYYVNGDSSTFFVMSGARLPFFVTSEVALGASIGFASPKEYFLHYIIGSIFAVVLLVLLLYQLCDVRGCYYQGPDKSGEFRFAALLSAATVTGALIGGIRRSLYPDVGPQYKNVLRSWLPLFAVVPLFTGSYGHALLENVPAGVQFTVFLFLATMAATFVPAGFALSLFLNAGRLKTAALCMGVEVALFALFRNWAAVTEANDLSGAAIQLGFSLAGAGALSLPGHAIGSRLGRKFAAKPSSPFASRLTCEELSLLGFSAAIFLAFTLSTWHFGVYAPVDMLPRDVQETYGHSNLLSGAPQPVLYTGAYNTASYFSTRRLEVTLDLSSAGKNLSVNDAARPQVLLAGMGAQSPNCCKDGLDYGYRADVAIMHDGKQYLVARAWETCDQNAACSGFPWQSTMHESESLVELGNHSKVSLAMQWITAGGKTVHWYYRLDNTTSWIEYSRFSPPTIENPAFNVGVIWVNNFAANFPSGNANFFQVGVASSDNSNLNAAQIAFECPAYYDSSTRHCFPDMKVIQDGDSHWKVLWQWGLPGKAQLVHIDNSKHTIGVIG